MSDAWVQPEEQPSPQPQQPRANIRLVLRRGLGKYPGFGPSAPNALRAWAVIFPVGQLQETVDALLELTENRLGTSAAHHAEVASLIARPASVLAVASVAAPLLIQRTKRQVERFGVAHHRAEVTALVANLVAAVEREATNAEVAYFSAATDEMAPDDAGDYNTVALRHDVIEMQPIAAARACAAAAAEALISHDSFLPTMSLLPPDYASAKVLFDAAAALRAGSLESDDEVAKVELAKILFACACVRMQSACCDAAASSAATTSASHMAKTRKNRTSATFKASFADALDAQSAALTPHVASLSEAACFLRRALQLSDSPALRAPIGCKLLQLVGVSMQLDETKGNCCPLWKPASSQYDASGQPFQLEGVLWRLAGICSAWIAAQRHAKRERAEAKKAHTKLAAQAFLQRQGVVWRERLQEVEPGGSSSADTQLVMPLMDVATAAAVDAAPSPALAPAAEPMQPVAGVTMVHPTPVNSTAEVEHRRELDLTIAQREVIAGAASVPADAWVRADDLPEKLQSGHCSHFWFCPVCSKTFDLSTPVAASGHIRGGKHQKKVQAWQQSGRAVPPLPLQLKAMLDNAPTANAAPAPTDAWVRGDDDLGTCYCPLCARAIGLSDPHALSVHINSGKHQKQVQAWQQSGRVVPPLPPQLQAMLDMPGPTRAERRAAAKVAAQDAANANAAKRLLQAGPPEEPAPKQQRVAPSSSASASTIDHVNGPPSASGLEARIADGFAATSVRNAWQRFDTDLCASQASLAAERLVASLGREPSTAASLLMRPPPEMSTLRADAPVFVPGGLADAQAVPSPSTSTPPSVGMAQASGEPPPPPPEPEPSPGLPATGKRGGIWDKIAAVKARRRMEEQ